MSKPNHPLLRVFALASFALIAVVPSVAQQRRPSNTPTDQFVFEGGGGFSAPAGGTSNQNNFGFNLMAGIGFKESRYLSTIGEYSYNHADLAQSFLNLEGFPDGHRTIHSITLNEKGNLSHGPTHAYLIGGGGWYHVTDTFTEPGGISCDPFTGICTSGDIILAQRTTNQAGFDAGAGFEHRFSEYSNAKLFVEARYNYIDTPGHVTQIVPVTFGVRF
jgi:opacity protein-like surface antigen